MSFVKTNKIPKASGQVNLGFGKYTDFYLFWINENNGEFQFNARVKFNKELKNNKVSCKLITQNSSFIRNAMLTIFDAYKKNDRVISKIIVSKNVQTAKSIEELVSEKFDVLLKELFLLNEKTLAIEHQIRELDAKLLALENNELNKLTKAENAVKVDGKLNPKRIKPERTPNITTVKVKPHKYRFSGLPKEEPILNQIECTVCGYIFSDILDECPICHKSAIEIIRKE